MDGYILSYRNPDTDSVCSSIVYYQYLQNRNLQFLPYIYGDVSNETHFVLDYAGISIPSNISIIDPIKSIILIDTHNLAHLPHLSSPKNVIEILDHHPDGDLSVFINAKIDNRKIGAVASIIADKLLSNDELDKTKAILLGSAILSNTINFSAPSTSAFDLSVFHKICKCFPFDKEYVKNMFYSKNLILKNSLRDVLSSDSKDYFFYNYRVRIAQLELHDFWGLINRKDIVECMTSIMHSDGLNFYIVSIIDVVRRKTYLFSCDKKTNMLLQYLLKDPRETNMFDINRIVLRKTDLVPYLPAAITSVLKI